MTLRSGRTELHHAAVDGDIERVRGLLADGADPSAVDQQGFTPLHFAAQSYQPEIIVLLLAAGAEVDRVNGVGNTALGVAVFNSEGRGEAIAALLAGGADPDLKNRSGNSPRDLANKIANYDIARFLPPAG